MGGGGGGGWLEWAIQQVLPPFSPKQKNYYPAANFFCAAEGSDITDWMRY